MEIKCRKLLIGLSLVLILGVVGALHPALAETKIRVEAVQEC
jgi:hypothetical protein